MPNNNEMILLRVGHTYPLALPKTEAVIADFLRPSGNRLIVYLDLDKHSLNAINEGGAQAGVLSKNGAMLLLFQFSNSHVVRTFDCPFNARLIKNIALENIITGQERLLIEIHIIQQTCNTLVGIRQITMSPELTLEFLSAVQDQLGSEENQEQHNQWLNETPEQLIDMTTLHSLGF